MRGFSFFLGTDLAGHTNCVSVFALDGRLLFCTDPAGYLNRAGGSPLTGGEFSLNISEGSAPPAAAGTLRRPPRGQKGRDTYGFPSSLNSYLSLVGIAWVQMVDCVSRKRTRQSGYSCVSFSAFSQFTDSVLLHIRATLRKARHDSAAQFFCALYRKAPANLGVWYNLSS